MIVSGENYRSIADQTEDYSYVFRVQPKDYNPFEVGLYGDYRVNYKFESGKIYDRENSFVDGYPLNKTCLISGNSIGGLHEYFINGRPKIVGSPIPSGKIYSLYYSGETPTNVNFDFFGQTPNYTISQVSSEIVSGEALTGQIVNNNPNINFKFFSGEIINSNIPVSLSGLKNQNITGINNFYLLPENANAITGDVDVRFYTNFGNIDFAFSLTGAGSPFIPDSNFYLTLQPFNNQFEGVDGSASIISSYSNPDGAEIKVSLSYISGQTGDIYADTTFQKNLSVSENSLITGGGLVSRYTEGVISGFDASGTLQTGLGSGVLTGEAYATGDITYDYEMRLTGLGSGFINQDALLFGNSYERFSGNVPYGSTSISKTITGISGSGFLNSSPVTGVIETGIGSISIDSTTSLPTGVINLPEGSYSFENLSQYLAYTGIITGEYDLIASGFAGPIIESGVFDQNFFANVKKGTYHFEKDYNIFVDNFDEIFLADSLGEIISGEKPLSSGLGFNLTGTISNSIDGSCLKESPTFEVFGSYSPDFHQISKAKAIFSMSKIVPSFTGYNISVGSGNSQTKEIYFYQDYTNVPNLKHYSSTGDIFVSGWRDQSLNNNIFDLSGINKIKALTGQKEFASGIVFDSPVTFNTGDDYQYVLMGYLTGTDYLSSLTGSGLSNEYVLINSSLDSSGIESGVTPLSNFKTGIVYDLDDSSLNSYSSFESNYIFTGVNSHLDQIVADILIYESQDIVDQLIN